MFGFAKRIAGATVNAAVAETRGARDIFEAYVAVAALMAAADGEVEDTERSKALRIIGNIKEIKGVFQPAEIETTFNSYALKAADSIGRQELAGELGDIKNSPEGLEVCKKLYLLAKDLAYADGELEPAEAKRLTVIAKLLNVDENSFAFEL